MQILQNVLRNFVGILGMFNVFRVWTFAEFAAQILVLEVRGICENEFPEISLKVLATRVEVKLSADNSIVETLSQYLNQ